MEQGIAQSQRHRHSLMLHSTGGVDVLQVHPGTATGFIDQLHKGFNVAMTQSRGLFHHPAVFLIDVNGSQNRPI